MHKGRKYPQTLFRACVPDCAINFWPPTYCKLAGVIGTGTGLIDPANADWASLDFDLSSAVFTASGDWIEGLSLYHWSFREQLNVPAPGNTITMRVWDDAGGFVQRVINTLGNDWSWSIPSASFGLPESDTFGPPWQPWTSPMATVRQYSDF